VLPCGPTGGRCLCEVRITSQVLKRMMKTLQDMKHGDMVSGYLYDFGAKTLLCLNDDSRKQTFFTFITCDDLSDTRISGITWNKVTFLEGTFFLMKAGKYLTIGLDIV
jgi:hypothetical protein